LPRGDTGGEQGRLLQLPRRPRLDPSPRSRRDAPSLAATSGTESRRSRITPAGSVGGDERLRLFLALRLPESVVGTLAEWQARELGRAQHVRIVAPDHLHITLAFLGSRPS